MKRYLAPAIMCVISALSGAAFVQAQQSRKAISTEDFVEIQRLLWSNHTGYDFAVRDNGDLWTSTFTPDAILDNGPSTHLVGEKEIRAYATDPAAKSPDRHFRHWTSTFHVTPNAEGAILSAFYIAVYDNNGRGPMFMGPTGRYESQVVKTKAGWKIKHHRVYSEGSIVTNPVPPASGR
jgi:hypothetical protein